MAYFSIVIPLFNKQNYIAATLRSVLDQTDADFEVIIVDDASTDQSLKAIENFNDARISLIAHQRNLGLSAARNTGIRAAKSNYIAFLDADDLWEPFFLEKMRELISKFPDAGIYGAGYAEYYANDQAILPKINLSDGPEMREIIDFYRAAAHQPLYCFSSVVIKKGVFEKAGYFDETINYGEDLDFNLRAHQIAKLAFYNKNCCKYIIHSENQITNSGIIGKKITDFTKYEPLIREFPSIKLYLDLNRYATAMAYKFSGQPVEMKQLTQGIVSANLTFSQKVMLNSPIWISGAIRKIKLALLRYGIRLTTFKNQTAN